MKITNPLATGTDLESLKYQSSMLSSMSYQLGTEAYKGDNESAMNPFLGFMSRVKGFAVQKLAIIPKLRSLGYKPQQGKISFVMRSNFHDIRTIMIPSIPDTNAMVIDYINYLEQTSRIVVNIVNNTLPDCKKYFSILLEDVSALSGAAQLGLVASLSNDKDTMEALRTKYPNIISRNDQNIAMRPVNAQYSSLRDFDTAHSLLGKITDNTALLKVDDVSRMVNDLNEIITRIIVKVKQKDNIEVSPETIKAVSEYLYQLADEVALVAAFAIHLEMAVKVLDQQVAVLNEVIPK